MYHVSSISNHCKISMIHLKYVLLLALIGVNVFFNKMMEQFCETEGLKQRYVVVDLTMYCHHVYWGRGSSVGRARDSW